MSKKIAAGSHSIVLDVKSGSGAFMKTAENAEVLAREMVAIGRNCGRRMAALITGMDRPLGYAVGNSLEVKEAIDVLRGTGPEDLRSICARLASVMLSLCHGWSDEESRKMVEDALDSGKAFAKFKEWIGAQGGNVAWIDDPSLFPTALYEIPVRCAANGYITHMDTEAIGTVGVILGAGRERKDDGIDPAAGILLRKKTGDPVKPGDILAILYTSKDNIEEAASARFLSALQFGETPPEEEPLVYKVIR